MKVLKNSVWYKHRPMFPFLLVEVIGLNFITLTKNWSISILVIEYTCRHCTYLLEIGGDQTTFVRTGGRLFIIGLAKTWVTNSYLLGIQRFIICERVRINFCYVSQLNHQFKHWNWSHAKSVPLSESC